jgi:hypothetical protein
MNQLFENYQDYVEAYENLNEVKQEKGFFRKAGIRGKAALRSAGNTFKGSSVGKHVIANAGKYKIGAAVAGTAAAGYGLHKLAKKRAAKKRMNEAQEFGISPRQFVYDLNVLREIKNLSESDRSIDYRDSRNNYFAGQRDAAIEQEYNDAAEYYDAQIR